MGHKRALCGRVCLSFFTAFRVLKACALFNIRQNTYKGFQKNNICRAFLATSQRKGCVQKDEVLCGWDLAECEWDLAECGWDLAAGGWDLAELLERLAVNAKGATVLGSIPESSDTVESEGRKMKQCWIKRKNQKIPLLEVLEVRQKWQYSGHHFYHFWSGAWWGEGWRLSSKKTHIF